MTYRVPSGVLADFPGVVQVSSYTNLAATGTVTLTVSTIYNPFLDLFLNADQICQVQLAGITQSTGSGSTYRNIDNVMLMAAASTPLVVRAYRVSFVSIQFTVTNNGAAATTTFEFSCLARSQ